ncbi:uncharacterized protein LOC118503379 [Anopheles stephensi]|uniref:uncharacterized protein LOC118503379 n=1 Tax=Anopheles stephensi TaxID=30069 RepID=UPI0016588ACE|nr:uncharacterized protein LOC118503379 [Anopheles stephensi]
MDKIKTSDAVLKQCLHIIGYAFVSTVSDRKDGYLVLTTFLAAAHPHPNKRQPSSARYFSGRFTEGTERPVSHVKILSEADIHVNILIKSHKLTTQQADAEADQAQQQPPLY